MWIYVNQALADSQYFFTDIYREGIVLYDSQNYQLGVPVPLPPARRLQLAKEDFDYWFEKVSDAWLAYELLFHAKRYCKAFLSCINVQKIY